MRCVFRRSVGAVRDGVRSEDSVRSGGVGDNSSAERLLARCQFVLILPRNCEMKLANTIYQGDFRGDSEVEHVT